jgi:thiosulfate reductase cytochrome b subunit
MAEITTNVNDGLLPIRARDLLGDLGAALRGRYANQDLTVYNAVQKVFYIAVLLAGVVVVLSGLAIWKPVQLRPLTTLFGGYPSARYVHFYAMAAIMGFLILHIVMAVAFPKRLRTMIRGY